MIQTCAARMDSDKIGVWPGNDDDWVMLRRGDGQVEYYDGER